MRCCIWSKLILILLSILTICLFLIGCGESGGEFQVNTYTQDDQELQSIDIDNEGNFVIAWISDGQDEDKSGVFAQRFGSNGNKIGNEFQANTLMDPADSLFFTSAVMADAGNFLIAWQSFGPMYKTFAQTYDRKGNKIGEKFEVKSIDSMAMDAAGNFVIVAGSTQSVQYEDAGVFAQRYDLRGNKIGQDFQVNTYTEEKQEEPSVAMDKTGNFVVAWSSEEQDGSEDGVFAQRFDSKGNKAGSEFQVNMYTKDSQYSPLVAMDGIGNFVVVWESEEQDGDGAGIYGQRYDNSGNKLGPEFQANTYTQGDQNVPSVAMDAAGNFVIAWQSWEQGSYYNIFSQRFDSKGNKVGNEFQVNMERVSFVASRPSIAMSSSGNFMIVWEGEGQGGDKSEIYAQRFDSNGNKIGNEFQVNTYTINSQFNPSVAMGTAGNFVIAWSSEGQDGSGYGVFAQHFDSNGKKLGQEFQVNTYAQDDQNDQSVAIDTTGNFLITWRSYDNIRFRYFAQRYDRNGNKLGNEFYMGESFSYPGSSIAVDAVGNFVVAWGGFTQNPQYEDGVFAQRYDLRGNEIGQDFQVNTYTEEKQEEPSVAMDKTGNFVVAWQSWKQDGDGEGIYAQRFDSNGNKIGNEFQVNTYTKGRQSNPLVTMDNAGNFVVAWYDWGKNSWEKDGRDSGIFAQRFDSNGNKIGNEFQVRGYTEEDIKSYSIVGVVIASYDMDMDDAGNFVITWEKMELGKEEDIYGLPVNSEIFAQRFDSNGNKVGPEFQVNTYTKSFQANPLVVMDNAGNFVITWESQGQDGNGNGIFARQYKFQ